MLVPLTLMAERLRLPENMGLYAMRRAVLPVIFY